MTRHFWTRLSFGAVLLAAGLLPVTAGAQSLAGVAKAEEARRKELAKPSKVYTNQNLRRDPTTPTASPAAAAPAPRPRPTPRPWPRPRPPRLRRRLATPPPRLRPEPPATRRTGAAA